MSWEMELDDEKLEDLYGWVDTIPLGRPKRRIERDFADGCMIAEIIKYFMPNFIELHNYTPANNLDQKKANWAILNLKVFSKLGINLPESVISNICNCRPGFVEVLLYNLRTKIIELTSGGGKRSTKSVNSKSKTELNTSINNGAMSRLNNRSRAANETTTNASQIVSRLEFEEKVQECYEQAEAIEVLQAKVRRLEHLVQLKDLRIQELCSKLDNYRPTAPPTEMKKLKI